jgi:uncharacterized protein
MCAMIGEFFLFEACIVFFSGIAHGVLGFGFPMLSTPLFALFMDLKQAVLYTLFPTISVNYFSLKKDNSFGSIWHQYRLLIGSVVVGSLMGTTLLVYYYTHYYKLILAGVILLYLNKTRLNISLSGPFKHSPLVMIGCFGFLSGFVGGIANIMIPVLIIVIMELNLEKKRAIGVMSFCFITNKVLQVILFSAHGSFNTETLMHIVPFVFIAVAGFFLGSRVQDRIDEARYRKVLNLVLWCLSVYLVVSTLYM